jgi:excisionase family DNA binding protein
MLPNMLTTAEFCRQFSISKTALYGEIRKGHLRALKLGRATRIARSEAERWAAELPALEGRPS